MKSIGACKPMGIKYFALHERIKKKYRVCGTYWYGADSCRSTN